MRSRWNVNATAAGGAIRCLYDFGDLFGLFRIARPQITMGRGTDEVGQAVDACVGGVAVCGAQNEVAATTVRCMSPVSVIVPKLWNNSNGYTRPHSPPHTSAMLAGLHLPRRHCRKTAEVSKAQMPACHSRPVHCRRNMPPPHLPHSFRQVRSCFPPSCPHCKGTKFPITHYWWGRRDSRDSACVREARHAVCRCLGRGVGCAASSTPTMPHAGEVNAVRRRAASLAHWQERQ